MERRKAPRIGWKAECVTFFANQSARGEVIDISEDGMAVSTPHPLPIGTFVRVQWMAPGMHLVDSDAIVVRDDRRNSEWVAGLRAHHLDTHVTALLKQMVAPRASSTPPTRTSTPPVAPSRPASGSRVAHPRRAPADPPPIGRRELTDLYRAALKEVGGTKKH